MKQKRKRRAWLKKSELGPSAVGVLRAGATLRLMGDSSPPGMDRSLSLFSIMRGCIVVLSVSLAILLLFGLEGDRSVVWRFLGTEVFM